MSDDCVTSCASLWHRYVSEELSQILRGVGVAWANDSIASTPHHLRALCLIRGGLQKYNGGSDDAVLVGQCPTTPSSRPPEDRGVETADRSTASR